MCFQGGVQVDTASHVGWQYKCNVFISPVLCTLSSYIYNTTCVFNHCAFKPNQVFCSNANRYDKQMLTCTRITLSITSAYCFWRLTVWFLYLLILHVLCVCMCLQVKRCRFCPAIKIGSAAVAYRQTAAWLHRLADLTEWVAFLPFPFREAGLHRVQRPSCNQETRPITVINIVSQKCIPLHNMTSLVAGGHSVLFSQLRFKLLNLQSAL